MASDSTEQWFAEIAPGVSGFRSGCFQLGLELQRLYAVREAGAIEAIVFYCARVLEALTADALARVQIPASVNVFSNLVTLEQYSLLATGAIYATNALRRLGNAARHIQVELTLQHAEISLALAEQVLAWFFVDLSVGPRLDRLGRGEMAIHLSSDAELQHTFSTAENLGRTWPDGWAELRERQGPEIADVAQAAAIVADIWLERNKPDAARDLLTDALVKSPDDLRLQQLMLLVASRNHEFESAREQIDQLMRRNSDDDETLGIAAGAYKRMWQSYRSATQWLAKSHQSYRNGWEKSKRQNTYLGINAATTALWLGKRDDSQRLAANVEQLLVSRTEQLKKSGFPDVRPDYWTQASLAEAILLQGKVAAAAAAIHSAVTQYPDSVGSIHATRTQMDSIAESLKLSNSDIEQLSQSFGNQ